MTSRHISSLKNLQWKYINEGNVHIVLELVGTPFVLRLIKEADVSTNSMTIINSVKFVNQIMLPLFYEKEIVEKEIILLLPESEMQEFGNELRKFRPKHRLVKTMLSSYAIRAPNLTITSMLCDTNYCVEIKPKEGFISSSLISYGKCHYCLKQYLKLHENQINNINEYCPLDLFSGDKVRMNFALNNLIKSPQNNLKIFKNGNIIFNETSTLSNFEKFLEEISCFNRSQDLFVRFIIEVLLNNDAQSVILDEISNINLSNGKSNCNTNTVLIKNCILNRIFKLQKCAMNYNATTYDHKTNNDYYNYVEAILKSVKDINLLNEEEREKFLHNSDPLHLAMIAAIARDCSIMISFTHSQLDDKNVKNIYVNGKRIYYKVTVTDLEPKAITTLAKRKVMEEKMIKAYRYYIKSSIS